MIHVYAYVISAIVFAVTLIFSLRFMRRISVLEGMAMYVAAITFAIAAIDGVLQIFALLSPTQFWAGYGLLSLILFIISLSLVALNLHTRSSSR